MYMCVCVCIYIYIYVSLSLYIYIYICIYIYIYICIYTYTWGRSAARRPHADALHSAPAKRVLSPTDTWCVSCEQFQDVFKL